MDRQNVGQEVIPLKKISTQQRKQNLFESNSNQTTVSSSNVININESNNINENNNINESNNNNETIDIHSTSNTNDITNSSPDSQRPLLQTMVTDFSASGNSQPGTTVIYPPTDPTFDPSTNPPLDSLSSPIPKWAVRKVHGSKDGTKNDSNEKGEEEREKWDKKLDFLLSIIGFAVDLANVWRFPYLCYKNGGGAFLIPYFVILVFGALPLFFMELVLGQCHQAGIIAVWKIVPIFKGIGICQCLIAFYVAFYYNVIIAWSFYYLVHSLTSVLPWSHCNNDWNTELCQDEPTFYNQTHRNSSAIINVDRTSPAQEFFERKALGLQNSHGLENLGPMRNELVLCLMAVFVLIYLSLWKGVKTSGKVVWVTATMPYLVLAILFVRGLFLPGSLDGIFYYLIPNLSKIGEWQVWIDAAVQIFFSVGAGFGVHIALASYNKTHHNCYRDCLITACVNSATSLFAGFVIFSYLGYMATRYGREISTVATEGPGLVFVVYPEAIATLPGSVFWSVIFFIMLITLGIDSAMGGLEALLTGISDVFRVELKKVRFSRELLTLVVVVLAFLFALPNVSSGGVYLVTLWDVFATGPAILFGVLMEAVAVSWFYGLNNFCADIQYALGFYPSIYWRICWKYISPLLLLVMILSSIIWFEPLRYMLNTKQHYVYPGWANVLGWMITSSSIIFIPLTALYLLTCKGRRTFRMKLALNISPYWEHEEIENGAEVTRFKIGHWLKFPSKRY